MALVSAVEAPEEKVSCWRAAASVVRKVRKRAEHAPQDDDHCKIYEKRSHSVGDDDLPRDAHLDPRMTNLRIDNVEYAVEEAS